MFSCRLLTDDELLALFDVDAGAEGQTIDTATAQVVGDSIFGGRATVHRTDVCCFFNGSVAQGGTYAIVSRFFFPMYVFHGFSCKSTPKH